MPGWALHAEGDFSAAADAALRDHSALPLDLIDPDPAAFVPGRRQGSGIVAHDRLPDRVAPSSLEHRDDP